MDTSEWENLVVEELKKLLRDDYRVRVLESQQTNPNRDLALGITKEGEENGIVVELDAISKKCIGQEKGIKPAAEYLAALYRQRRSGLPENALEHNTFPVWKDRIVFMLKHPKNAEERLLEVPHEEFLGIKIVFGLADKRENPCCFRPITNEDLKSWKITVPELLALARRNTSTLYPPYICGCEGEAGVHLEMQDKTSIEEFLKAETEKRYPMYLLTNAEEVNGAACMLYDGVLENLAQKWQEDIAILPICVDNVALIPASKLDRSLDEWQAVVMEANQDELLQDSNLADFVYVYDREAGEIKIASTGTVSANHYTS